MSCVVAVKDTTCAVRLFLFSSLVVSPSKLAYSTMHHRDQTVCIIFVTNEQSKKAMSIRATKCDMHSVSLSKIFMH